MELSQELKGLKVALDTSVFIYFLEEHPDYLPLVRPVFLAAEQQHLTICTSVITLHEVWVLPYRQRREDLI